MSHLTELAAAALSATQERASRRAKGIARRSVLLGAAGFLFAMGFVYLSLAVHAALEASFGEVAAGFAVCAGLSVIGIILVLVALLSDRNKPNKEIPAVPSQDAAMHALLRDAQKLGKIGPVVALALGFLMSRK